MLQVFDIESNGSSSDDSYYNVRITRDNAEDVEERVRVNNTVVDNEFDGQDVAVLPSWRRKIGMD